MTLRHEFIPSVPDPSPEEMRYAHDAVVAKFQSGAKSLPEDVQAIFERRDQVAQEFSEFMRSDASEIVSKMLPDSEPLTLDLIMDMLHVYYWWDLNSEEPANKLYSLLADLSRPRFEEAVEVLHDEFRDLCAESRDIAEPVCESTSGMKCLKQSIRSMGRRPKKTLASPRRRAVGVLDMLLGVDFSRWHFNQEFLEDDADELLYSENSDGEDDYVPVTSRRPCHSLAEVLGRHAVERLLDAGLDDIEAMEVNRVLSIEATLRQKGGVLGEDYALFRNSGGTAEDYLQGEAVRRMNDSYFFDLYVQPLEGETLDYDALSESQKLALAKRSVEEDINDFALLEAYYQLEENGIQPFYRRQFAEDYFPATDRI